MADRKKELLLQLRSKLVSALHVQPYIIYDDDTIELLLKKKPKTLDDLKDIKGFPEKGKRFKGFGAQIVAIFNDTDNVGEFNVDSDGSISQLPKKMEF